MNAIELSKYYVENRNEFFEERGHDKLLVGLKQYIKQIDTTKTIVGLDVGCCVGDYIPHLQELCTEPNAKILCFEPNPVNIAKLEPKIEHQSNIRLLKHCVSNETSKASFYNWMGFQNNEAGNGCAGLRSGGKKICEVDVKRLDDVLTEEFANEDIIIKFMKVDTEGNDSNVIKGLLKYLPVTKYIIFECSDCLDDNRGPGIQNPMKDIVDFLSSNGFDTYRIGTKKLFKVNDEYWSQTYEDVKFWSNCFSLKKEDGCIHSLIDENFDYRF